MLPRSLGLVFRSRSTHSLLGAVWRQMGFTETAILAHLDAAQIFWGSYSVHVAPIAAGGWSKEAFATPLSGFYPLGSRPGEALFESREGLF